MGSGYFGIPSMRSEKSSSSSSSSRKNKKSSGSDKPKQPQRGLGVAQLEQIRLRTQMACGFNPPSVIQEDMMRVQGVGPYGVVPVQSSTSYPNNYSQSSSPSTSSTYNHQPNYVMTFGDENLGYQNSQSSTAHRWNPNSTGVLDNATYGQSGMPRPLPFFEDHRHGGIDLMRSSSRNSDSSDHEEVDLELRLSI